MSTNVNTTSNRILFTSIVLPGTASEIDAVLLAASIRDHAGSLAHAPICFFVPEGGKQLSTTTQSRLDSLNVRLISCTLDKELLHLPLAHYPRMAAAAESIAQDTTELLIWLGTNTIVLQEPSAFILPSDKTIGYRPVHHINIGSAYGTPLDTFWKLIYDWCEVPEDRIFPMKTQVDDQMIRPYFNAGCLITRPQSGIFRAWRNTFSAIHREDSFRELYQQDERYAIFMHQAVLSGIILHRCAPDEMHELPGTYNYPLHLYAEDSTAHRPSTIEECMTIRHEGFYKAASWAETIPAREPLKQWFARHLPAP